MLSAAIVLSWLPILLPFLSFNEFIPFSISRHFVSVSCYVSEHSLGFLLLKWLGASMFDYPPQYPWIYYGDVLFCLLLWSLFLKAHNSFWRIEERTGEYWKRFIVPSFFRYKGLLVVRDICYSENQNAQDQHFLMLDVYKNPRNKETSPVLVYIHDGLWTGGDKNYRCPVFVQELALAGKIVVTINHRLNSPYPAHLIDVKRAIRWVRLNISKFNGDPDFISISGSNSGAYLAVMAALTQNDPFYQPGFEDDDTSIQSCVSINGVYELSNEKRYYKHDLSKWFVENVMKTKFVFERHDPFLKASSPIYILRQMDAEKSRTEGKPDVDDSYFSMETPLATAPFLNLDIPPIILFHGKGDSLFPYKLTREFAYYYRKVAKEDTQICSIEFPNANNLYDRANGPRARYLAYGIDRFISHVYKAKTAATENQTRMENK